MFFAAALFQSLLYEAAGRTVNPVNGAVGLLWTGNWHVCQAAVETVLRGGALRPIPEFLGGAAAEVGEASDCTDPLKLQDPSQNPRSKVQKRRRLPDGQPDVLQLADLDLSLNPGFQSFHTKGYNNTSSLPEKRRPGTPSMNSEESVTTTCFDSRFGGTGDQHGGEPKLLNLFN